ncbi:hypothetical protein BLNAU_1837 [Blattamonas nauphoetae]|uniref:Saposin B-type domain-containing protein n=1 Tax=Blattamonas nauphoetae TaxID=2049346 RepID=A0ABQ9YHR0_9EUKA|nr:hypothetical protein BLNAU_1837 [Blattamonas nauphoetae]
MMFILSIVYSISASLYGREDFDSDYLLDDDVFDLEEDSYDTFGQCDLCKELVYQAINSGYSGKQQVMDYAIKQVCPLYPSMRDACQRIGRTVIPNYYFMIVNKVSPASICGQAKMCP